MALVVVIFEAWRRGCGWHAVMVFVRSPGQQHTRVNKSSTSAARHEYACALNIATDAQLIMICVRAVFLFLHIPTMTARANKVHHARCITRGVGRPQQTMHPAEIPRHTPQRFRSVHYWLNNDTARVTGATGPLSLSLKGAHGRCNPVDPAQRAPPQFVCTFAE